MSREEATVFFDSKIAGLLTKSETGYSFQYDPGYLAQPSAKPISLSLPLQKEEYTSPQLFSFFEGLLPEGWLLEITSTAAKIDPEDHFHLLLHTGRDPVGAVSVRPKGEAINE